MMMLITTSLVLIASTLSIFFFSTIYCFSLSVKTRLKGLPPLPPGSLGLPIIGESLSFVSDPKFFRSSRHAKHGDIFKTNVFGTTVFLRSTAANKFLFSNERKLLQFTSPPSLKNLIGPNSLSYKAGDSHKLARRHLNPFFNPPALVQYVSRIEQHTKNHLARHWHSSLETQDGEEFEIAVLKSVKQLAFSILTDLVMSSDEYETEELRKLGVEWNLGAFMIPISFPGSAYHRALKARAGFLEKFDEAIAKRRVELADGTASSTQDFLSYLLTKPDESGKINSEEEVKDNLLLLFAAGHDTVSSVTAMTLRFISMYPDVQHRLKEEHDAVAKRIHHGNGLTKEAVWEMKYTWWVIQESMRMQATIRGGFRQAIKDFEYDGFTILKGWKLLWTSTFHMDPQCFKDPERFDPTRFNGENEIIPFSYVPFGGGPRKCPGNEFAKMESIIVIYHVMRNYTFALVDPDEPVIYDPLPTQKSGMIMKVKKLAS